MAAVGAALHPAPAGAQSLLERPPNLSGNWTGVPGTLYFHFLHRFSASQTPEKKVSNVPTFLVGAGLPGRLLVGMNYSTNSTLAPRFPNEWELLARWAPLSADEGAPLDLGGQVAYNNAAAGVDAELSAARRLGVTRMLVAGRALSDPLERGNVRFAVAGGAAIRLGTYVSLAGDVATLADRAPGEQVAWSAGLHLAIPLSPHTVAIQASNAAVTTLQGASRGSDAVRYGFEFTIPLTLRRYVGRRAEPAAPAPPPPVAAQPDSAAATTHGERVAAAAAAPSAAPSALRPDSVADAPVPAHVVPTDTGARVARPHSPPPAAAAPLRSTTGAGSRPAAPAARAPARVVRGTIKNLKFLQANVEVTVGTTVEWTNSDPLPHTVTASDRSFDSGLIQPGRSYRHTFTKPGSFAYFCTPHPFMKGVVVVKAP